ncbi:hypothetical protein THAOC_02523 [Thalassiosira oceanica]|uniref:Uncharacterized protein n=1 Tax=Thalassiosira oceanica TaxID=159749 RepID=K0TEE2_THAOC|nr:hypothetical protein THAOC_02523 [Thalassiosira oceanica]|eukprot:EJK75745.1 hypothetical protein THAOC_02523 [Thalassiosira oceanica]
MSSANDRAMSPESNRKRSRGNDEAAASASLADLWSMLRQALGRIDSLEMENVAIRGGSAALRKDLKSLQEENKAMRGDMDKIKDENRALKWSLKQLAGRVQQSWEYPEEGWIQPDAYWHNEGFDDDYISDLNEGFIYGVKSAVSGLVHGVCDHVCIGDIGDESDEGRMILHDAALVPHWSTLCEYLYTCINPYGSGVNISLGGIQLSEEVMRDICNNLRGRNVREVAFTGIQFTDMRAAILALGTLLISSRVESLVWSDIPIESADDMALFVQMMSERHSGLEKLKFGWNGEGNANALLAGVDLSKYKSLDFEGNNLQTNGRADIPNLIASNSPLESLDLDSNNLNDDDAVLIAESLRQNTNLKALYLDGNNIHQRGRSALLRAMRDTSSMNALSDSNHTCEVAGLNEVINSIGQLNRAFKIHNLMVERYRSGEGNIPYLNREMDDEGAVCLAPLIMESVHRRHIAIKEKYGYKVRGVSVLGLLYELVRDWRMPELFSFN